MDAKPPTPEIQDLILRSHAAREDLGKVAEILRSKLDAPARVRESMRTHPGRWLLGATATGLATSRLLFRRPRAGRTKKPQSMIFFILRILSSAAMPAVKIWLLAQIKTYLTRRHPGNSPTFTI